MTYDLNAKARLLADYAGWPGGADQAMVERVKEFLMEAITEGSASGARIGYQKALDECPHRERAERAEAELSACQDRLCEANTKLETYEFSGEETNKALKWFENHGTPDTRDTAWTYAWVLIRALRAAWARIRELEKKA